MAHVPSFACIVQLKCAAVGMLMHALSMKSDKRTRCPQGTFEHNVFQGHGVLEWSVKAEHV